MMNIILKEPSNRTREAEILSTAQRKVAQGVSAERQYADLNVARDKRKRRRERNVKLLLQGGYKQVLFVEGPMNNFKDFQKLVNAK